MDELQDIFEEGQPPVEQQAPETPEAQEAPESDSNVETEQPRGPDGKFVPKGNDNGAMPAPEEKTIPIQSYQAEKQKRQEWETRYRDEVETLRRELEEIKKPKQPEAPPPSIWEDEQATFSHYGQQITSRAVEQATYQSKLQMSEMMARQSYADFGDLWEPMNEFLRSNPAVIEQASQAAHPWDHAYKAYKNYTTMQELGATDIETLRSKLREEIMAEQARSAPAIPRSLADAQSSKGGNGPAPKPLTLEDILGT